MEIFTRDFVSLSPFPTSTHTTRDRSIDRRCASSFFFLSSSKSTGDDPEKRNRLPLFTPTREPPTSDGRNFLGAPLGSGGTSRRERTHTMNTLAQVRAMRRPRIRTTTDEDARRRGRRCAMTRMHDAWRDGSMIMERGNRRNEWNGTRRNEMGWMKRTTGWKRETEDDG